MICPKCGFSQPDDLYCANCGINVEKHLQKNKKTFYTRGLVIAFVCVIGVFAVRYFYSTPTDQEIHTISQMPPQASRPVSPQTEEGTLKPAQAREDRQPFQKRTTGPSARGGGEKASSDREPTKVLKDEGPGLKSSAKAGPGTGQAEEEEREAQLTAQEWLDKGKALDDDSMEETKCYLNAIQTDPGFAPAYYRLGGIYFRHAEYDLADQAFTKFLKLASEEDRRIYNIYVYYSPAEVENFLQELEGGGRSETSSEREQTARSPQDGDEDSEATTNKELKTVVNFNSIRGHISVPVVLNGSVQVNMLLDTGAGVTLVSRDVAETLGLSSRGAGFINLKTIAEDVRVPLMKLDFIRFGDFGKRNFPVAVWDLNIGEKGFDGILGMDFLGDYNLIINNKTSHIVLTPRTEVTQR
jgi:predicted aspartyl protease